MARGGNRDALFEAGRKLIKRQGYAATGVQEIADSAGVPKGSFYNYFKSKEAFSAEIAREHAARISETLEAALSSPGVRSKSIARLKKLFRAWVDELRKKRVRAGCLIGNLCQEVASQPGPMRGVLCESLDLVESRLVACLKQARQNGELPNGLDPRQTGKFIYNAWQGTLLRAKAERTDESLDAFLDIVFNRLLK